MFKYFIIFTSFLLVSCGAAEKIVYVTNSNKEQEFLKSENEKLELKRKLDEAEKFAKKLEDEKQKLEQEKTELKIKLSGNTKLLLDKKNDIERINSEKQKLKQN